MVCGLGGSAGGYGTCPPVSAVHCLGTADIHLQPLWHALPGPQNFCYCFFPGQAEATIDCHWARAASQKVSNRRQQGVGEAIKQALGGGGWGAGGRRDGQQKQAQRNKGASRMGLPLAQASPASALWGMDLKHPFNN